MIACVNKEDMAVATGSGWNPILYPWSYLISSSSYLSVPDHGASCRSQFKWCYPSSGINPETAWTDSRARRSRGECFWQTLILWRNLSFWNPDYRRNSVGSSSTLKRWARLITALITKAFYSDYIQPTPAFKAGGCRFLCWRFTRHFYLSICH